MLSRIVLTSLALVLAGMYAVRAAGADQETADCCVAMANKDHAACCKDAANNSCPMMAKDAEFGSCPMATKATSRPAKVTVYTCPMDPEVVSNKPGKCPKCGMNLVPRQQEPKAAKKPADKSGSESGHTHNH